MKQLTNLGSLSHNYYYIVRKEGFGRAAASANPPTNTRDPLGHPNSAAFLPCTENTSLEQNTKAVLWFVISVRREKLSLCCITEERWLVLVKDLDNSWLWRRSQSNQFHPDCVFSISKYTLPTQILQSERVPKFRDLVCLVNWDTCCQFVSVVWLKNSLGPDAYVNAQEGRGGETCQCGFLFCHLSILQPPRRRAASWRWSGGNPGLRSSPESM